MFKKSNVLLVFMMILSFFIITGCSSPMDTSGGSIPAVHADDNHSNLSNSTLDSIQAQIEDSINPAIVNPSKIIEKKDALLAGSVPTLTVEQHPDYYIFYASGFFPSLQYDEYTNWYLGNYPQQQEQYIGTTYGGPDMHTSYITFSVLRSSLPSGNYYVRGITTFYAYPLGWTRSDNRSNLVALPKTISIPGNLKADYVRDTYASISWSKVAGATGYHIYLNGSLIKTTTSTSYLITGLQCSKSYQVSVTAYNAEAESVKSNITITTLIKSIPVSISGPSELTNSTPMAWTVIIPGDLKNYNIHYTVQRGSDAPFSWDSTSTYCSFSAYSPIHILIKITVEVTAPGYSKGTATLYVYTNFTTY